MVNTMEAKRQIPKNNLTKKKEPLFAELNISMLSVDLIAMAIIYITYVATMDLVDTTTVYSHTQHINHTMDTTNIHA